MNPCYPLALALLAGGCARQKAPVVTQVPTVPTVPTVIAAPTPTPVVVRMPTMPPRATPTPSADEKWRRAVITRELARLQTASPEQDFERAWANKDTRFISMKGAGEYAPGVPPENQLALFTRYGSNPIEGTTDFMEFPQDPQQTQLAKLAFRYATRYNRLLLQKLDEQPNANGT